MKPNFSGEWILNRPASTLTEGAAAIESGVLRIDHADSHCKFQIDMKAGAESAERAWECSMSAQRDVAEGGFWTHLSWDGDVLVFGCGAEGWTMSWRYDLIATQLRAVEQMRGERNFQNTWIFERSSRAGL